MKSRVILLTIYAVVFLGVTAVKADDMSELKDQIKALQETINSQQKTIESLNSKVQTIEVKQEAQSKEIRKVPELAQKVGELKEKPAGKGLFEGVTVGGHLKFAIYDRTQGKRNGIDQHNNGSAGFIGPDGPLYLTFGKQLADWLRMDIRTLTEATASATPSLGSDISRTTTSTFNTSVELGYLTALLPRGYELKVGKFRPMFSEDYTKETWWHELYNLPLQTCTLQAWTDSNDFGAELYKNFDFDKWSLPAYFSVLNGNGPIDNNENKAVLLHLAPEFFQTKLRLLGSFGYGKWDNKDNQDMFRTAYGFDWKYQKFNLRGEYIYSLFKNVVVPSGDIVPTADGKNEGYWVKAIYTFNPRWRAVVEESYTNLYQAALSATQKDMLSDKWYTTSLALDYSLTPNSTIIGQYDISDGHRSNGSESLKFDRITIGWRTSF